VKTNGHGNGHDHAPKLRFPLQRFGEIMLDGSQRYLIKGLVPTGSLVVVWGPPKCGKSFLVTDMALHIALGREYRGRKVSQGTVIYITCEGQSGFPARIEAYRQYRMGEDEEAPSFYLLSTRLDLVSEADRLVFEITAQLGIVIPALIVIDTLNRSLTGSENSDEDMSAYILACDKLRERFKCAVMIIHHCGIDGTRPRGHTSLQGAVDAQIAVCKDEAKNVVAKVEYMKDGPDDAQFVSRLEQVIVGEDEDGDDITSCVIEALDDTQPQRVTKPKKVRIPASARVAQDTLSRSISGGGGEPAPASNHIPAGKTVVRIDLWRKFYYAALGDDDSQEAKKKSFQRARIDLLAAGQIGVWENWVWLV
jgi:hypothetical protein